MANKRKRDMQQAAEVDTDSRDIIRSYILYK